MNSYKKESTESVEVLLKAGVSRKEIFQQLGGTDDLARIIALVPSYENRKNYRRENLVLIVVLIYLEPISKLLEQNAD